MHNWRFRLVALVLLTMVAIVACSATTEPAGGLQLIVATNLLAPTDFDTVRLEVRQEVSQGQWGSPLIANDFRVPGETTLPTTFAIVAGKSANQNALIRVIALKGQRPLVLREVQIQIPTTRVAALKFVLASSCAGKLKVDATGSAQSTCADRLQSCQPDTGECGSTVVDIASLPNYNPGDENGVSMPPGGDGGDATVSADAGVDAPREPPGAPTAVSAEPVAAYVVTTLAGSGAYGYADGTGAAASFRIPDGVALDSAGNVYVGDSENHRIRKVTPAGVVTTLAGSGGFGTGGGGFADGPSTVARFRSPRGLATDAAGNVYVADRENGAIRKVGPDGFVTTLAGVTFGVRGLATDAAGNVYVGDSGCIRKVTPAGVVTTLAGSPGGGFADGTGESALFSNVWGVAVDAARNVYVADAMNRRIRKVTAAGVVTTLAGSGTEAFQDGTGAGASFMNPLQLALAPAGNLYVADANRIRSVTPDGVVTTVAGSGSPQYQDGTGAAAGFSTPRGITVGPTGTFYVADSGNHRIRKIDPGGVGQLAITWTAPSTTGSSVITGYVASASAAGHPTRTCTAPAGARSCTVSGLMSNAAYRVVVTASNAVGPGAASAPTTATPN